ncbi:MAG: hydantoinase B/oxoprolinase family protein [Bacillota bacterium]
MMAEMEKPKVDPVTTEIIRNALVSAAEEMNAALTRSAYSLSIYEMKDCSVGLFDEEGEVLGQASGLPIFLGNLGEAIRVTTAKYGRDAYREGDAYILNDSYLCGTHLGDVTIFSPVFYQGDLVGFAATRAHWIDVGAKDPAVSVDSTEIFQEGIRLGPTRLCQDYRVIRDIADILAANTRFPRNVMGDMNAQIAACRTGEARFKDIIRKYGLATVREAVRNVFDQCERLDREAVEKVPDGEYEAEGCLDNDGHDYDQPVPVKVKVVVQGSDMTIDLTGSSPQRQGATNCGLAQTISACRVAFKFLFNSDFPVTGGTFRNLKVVVPKGSMFAAEPPAACQWYYTALGLLIDLVIKALAPVLPDRTAAAHFGDSMVVWCSGTDPRNGARWLHAEITAGGWGGSLRGDGESALVNAVNGEHRNLPVEVLENKFPIRILEYGLRRDSAGPGRYRGGLGVVRRYQFRAPASLSTWFERSRTPAWGLLGGGDAARPQVVVKEGQPGQRTLLKVNMLPVEAGDLVTAMTGGGGGYGSPLVRDPAAVREDVLEGFVSPEAAERDYGVVLDPVTMEVDEEATARLRAARRA